MTDSRMATASSISSSVTSSDGASRRAVGVTALTTRPASRAAAATGPALLPRPVRPRPAGPGPAPPLTPGSLARAAVRYGAGRPGPGRDVLGLHDRQHGPGGRRRQGLAAERGGVVAGPERRGHVVAGPAGADRHAVAQRLGHRDHVGRDAVVLEPEPLPGAAQARLDLVDDQQRCPARRRGGRTAWKYSAPAGFTPPSPCTGSSSTAGHASGRGPTPGRRCPARPRGGSPRAAAGTARAWPAGRWRAGWPGCGRGTSRRR